ncbi:hypothetical protein WA026_019473 [Henosepilachna vigintioctopunctata]|uniref:Uncharacterized protein n=1 Tax=Henosepilachna vigintioctopunctata TaxID=420089 RepID=A0AAW1U5D0_9CUCU
MGAYSEEQGERFHQDIMEFERRYQGQYTERTLYHIPGGGSSKPLPHSRGVFGFGVGGPLQYCHQKGGLWDNSVPPQHPTPATLDHPTPVGIAYGSLHVKTTLIGLQMVDCTDCRL